MSFPSNPINGQQFTNSFGTTYKWSSIRNAWIIDSQTIIGATGVQGSTGMGIQGSTGVGSVGQTGVMGVTGLSGGPQGVTGPQGPTGIFVTSYGEVYGMTISSAMNPGTYSSLMNGIAGNLSGMTVDSSSRLVVGSSGIYSASYTLCGRLQNNPDDIFCHVFRNDSTSGMLKSASKQRYFSIGEGEYVTQSKSGILLNLNSGDVIGLKIAPETFTQGISFDATFGTLLTLVKVG